MSIPVRYPLSAERRRCVVAVDEIDASVETRLLKRVLNLLLRADDDNADAVAELLLGEDEHAQSGAGDIFEVVHHQYESLGSRGGRRIDRLAELRRDLTVELAGERDRGHVVV